MNKLAVIAKLAADHAPQNSVASDETICDCPAGVWAIKHQHLLAYLRFVQGHWLLPRNIPKLPCMLQSGHGLSKCLDQVDNRVDQAGVLRRCLTLYCCWSGRLCDALGGPKAERSAGRLPA